MSGQILIIDDDSAIRKAFSLTLEDEGYKVDAADSGAKGIEMRKRHTYDLIFLDMKMPGLDGVDTLLELRKIDADGPIYIITAFHEEFFSRLRDAGKMGNNYEVLRKPISREKLISVVRSVLEDIVIY